MFGSYDPWIWEWLAVLGHYISYIHENETPAHKGVSMVYPCIFNIESQKPYFSGNLTVTTKTATKHSDRVGCGPSSDELWGWR